jgi:hypothetical protein
VITVASHPLRTILSTPEHDYIPLTWRATLEALFSSLAFRRSSSGKRLWVGAGGGAGGCKACHKPWATEEGEPQVMSWQVLVPNKL